MMTSLILLFTIAMLCAFKGKRMAAITIGLINLVLFLLLFWHHITVPLPINL